MPELKLTAKQVNAIHSMCYISGDGVKVEQVWRPSGTRTYLYVRNEQYAVGKSGHLRRLRNI